MTPSDDLSPPRRPIFFPVVIATVFLTIIGMTVGYVLGQHDNRSARADSPTQGAANTTSPVMTGPECPDATQQSAATLHGHAVDLRQKFKIRTTNGTDAWICVDATGRLYYQGRTGAGSDIVQGKNGLFMYQVTDEGDDNYLAVNDQGFKIEVNRDDLVVHKPTGETATYRVATAE